MQESFLALKMWQRVVLVVTTVSLIILLIWLAVLGIKKLATTGDAPSTQATASPSPNLPTEYSMKGEDGKLPNDLLRQKATIIEERINNQLIVTSINGLANTKANNWLLYINSRLVSDSLDRVTLNTGDEIVWRYQMLDTLK